MAESISKQSEEIYREIHVSLEKDLAMDLTIALDADKLPHLIGYYELLYQEGKYSERSTIVLYFQGNDLESRWQVELFLMAEFNLDINDYTIEEVILEKEDYLLQYKNHYHSFQISERIIIVPSWEKPEYTKSKSSLEIGKSSSSPEIVKDIYLYLDPGLAFGTGQHATTRLCLSWLDRNFEKGSRVIDAGCGSGILAIGCVLLGAEKVIAFDVDGNAVKATDQNARLNSGVRDKLEIHEGGFDIAALKTFKADLLIANITANIIIPAKQHIDSANHRRMILSGVLEEAKDQVISQFENGWKLQSLASEDGWCLLEFER